MQAVQILDLDFPAFVRMIFKAKRTPCIKGPPGCGKSAMTEALARQLDAEYAAEGGYGYFEIDMSKANIADWQGFLMPEDETIIDADGQPIKIKAGKYTYPYWAYDKFTGRPIHTFRHGVITFEEWAQGDPEVKRAAASMIYGRRIGLYHFPDFDCILLGNRDIDRAGATKEYDHIINRLTIAEMKPTLKNFIVVAEDFGMTPITKAFAARNETKLFSPTVPKDQGPYLTQRSLHALDDIVRAALDEGRDLEDPLLLAAAAGTVGREASSDYMAFVKARHEIPTVREVVSDPTHCRIPDRLDLVTFLVYDLAAKTDRSNISAITQYINRLKSDMASTYFDSITRRDKSLVMTAEFSAYAKKNMPVLAAAITRQ